VKKTGLGPTMATLLFIIIAENIKKHINIFLLNNCKNDNNNGNITNFLLRYKFSNYRLVIYIYNIIELKHIKNARKYWSKVIC